MGIRIDYDYINDLKTILDTNKSKRICVIGTSCNWRENGQISKRKGHGDEFNPCEYTLYLKTLKVNENIKNNNIFCGKIIKGVEMNTTFQNKKIEVLGYKIKEPKLIEEWSQKFFSEEVLREQ